MSDPNTDFTATQDCMPAPSSIVCKESAGGSEANFPGSSTTTYEGTETGKLTLTVTAGKEKLVQTSSVSGTSSATSSQSVAPSASTASITPMPGSGSAAASSIASRTGSAPAQASTAAAAVNAIVMGGSLSGAAAAVFGGLLL
ncbi:hypothetical protein N0V94_004207 [Neodidymelliopsis sp. IMI 364377]|nr:hypothetical protein N0V94_004207 [Neodidymelliopsis sp. IMI 364377]